MSDTLETRVASALSRIQNPRLENDLLSAGMVRDLEVDANAGRVAFTFLLGRNDPATLVRETRAALRALEGVAEVKITVVDPAGPSATTHAAPGAPAGAQPVPVAPEWPELGKVVAVSSGKGGVGKSTVAANLAVAMAKAGLKVGLMDADIYGPNIPRMFGLFEKPPVEGGKIIPLEAHGVKLISLGFLMERDAPVIWRGPIIMKVITQFLKDVAWGGLDVLVVDLPPGTGDAQLSLVQTTQVAGGIIVTTPQEVAVGDALRGAKMFERVQVPVFGVIENMSGFTTPAGERIELFGAGGGQRLADELGVPLLGQVPLQPGVAQHADRGLPIMVAEPESEAARVLASVAERVVAALGSRAVRVPIIRG
ncbi:MAG TPA: Mrp/NBP35 family ATP-binding protein [Gemmatimonadales bacterium]|nr:Mrp/NBP35 family ATP-binding protein [Gemmatimonadales bacterium]